MDVWFRKEYIFCKHFKNIDLIPITSDYKGAAVRIDGRSIFMYCTVADNFEKVVAEKGV